VNQTPKNIFEKIIYFEIDFIENILRRKPFYVETNGALIFCFIAFDDMYSSMSFNIKKSQTSFFILLNNFIHFFLTKKNQIIFMFISHQSFLITIKKKKKKRENNLPNTPDIF
jgi:uncharacterized sporulation protein YeaH/YhbH (DUF444 family)